MRLLIQRVARAAVRVEGDIVAAIGPGMLALVGITHDDTEAVSSQLALKAANLRVFDDEAGVMNRSILELRAAGEPAAVLAVSQFTLYADCRKGRRPSYVNAARPEHARPLVDQFVGTLRMLEIPVETGVFGAEMAVELVNDGPVTIMLDSAELGRAV
jgi:D-tyrosyl-tRNA(Tyr) deacylase